MDVRCERCRAQYVFDDEQVTPQGLTVQCTNCGHVFRVKKKELVVTVAVRPEDITEPPVLAEQSARRPAGAVADATPRPPPPPPPAPPAEPAPQGWTIRQTSGATLTFTELTTLQKWIVERKVGPDDQISQGADAWVRLGLIGELQSFFEVVDAADRGRRTPVTRPGGTDFYPPPPFPPPAMAPPGAPPPASAPPPPPPVATANLTAELGPEELAAVRGRKSSRASLAVAGLLVLALAAVLYAFAPAISLIVRGGAAGPGGAPASPPATATAPLPAPPAVLKPPAEPAVAVAAPAATGAPVTPPIDPARPSEPGPPEPAVEKPVEKPAPPPASQAPSQAGKLTEPALAAAPARPAGGPARPGSGGLLVQADTLRKRGQPGDTARALDLYGQLLADDPENVRALTGRGLCYFELGQYPPAEVSFQRALQQDPGQPEALMGLAETYRSRGKLAEARPLYQRYLEQHPDGEDAAVARYALGLQKE